MTHNEWRPVEACEPSVEWGCLNVRLHDRSACSRLFDALPPSTDLLHTTVLAGRDACGWTWWWSGDTREGSPTHQIFLALTPTVFHSPHAAPPLKGTACRVRVQTATHPTCICVQDNIAVKKELKNSKLADYEYEKTLGEDTRRGQFRGGDACYAYILLLASLASAHYIDRGRA